MRSSLPTFIGRPCAGAARRSAEPLDVAARPEHEARAGRPAQPLAAAEQHEVGAGLA